MPQDPHGQPEPRRFGPVGPEGAGPVGETEVARRRQAQHVGAVVPPVGNERDAVERREGAQPLARGSRRGRPSPTASPAAASRSTPARTAPLRP